MPPTIKDIAGLASVSISTVSLALKDSDSVREETRVRIKDIAERLGYRPNPLGRGLASRRTLNLGLVVPGIETSLVSEILSGMESVTWEQGYHIMLACSDEDPERERQLLESLRDKMADGIVLFPVQNADGDNRAYVRELAKETPLVLLGNPLEQEQVACVVSDEAGGGHQAAEYLIGLGHKRIAYVTNTAGIPSRERMAGYRTCLREHGLDYDPALIVSPASYPLWNVEGVEETLDILMGLPLPPTALFFVNDDLAIVFMRSLAKRGIRIPEEVSVVGFDDVAIGRRLPVALTTISQPKRDMGEAVARYLLERIDTPNDSQGPRTITLPTTLVARESASHPR